MTIILSYQRKNSILMLGDLMISGQEEKTRATDIPTRFSKNQPETNLFFTALSQKVFAINDHLAVAWAGSKVVAETLVRKISLEIEEPYSAQKVLDLISSSGLLVKELNSVSFIFCLVDTKKKQLVVQDYNTGETIIDEDQKFKYSGTGTFHFLDSIGFEFKETTGSLSDYEMMISTLLGRMAIALYEEINTDITHNFFYG